MLTGPEAGDARVPTHRAGSLSRAPGPAASAAVQIGGQSEHKEGRAWDWGVNAGSESDRKKVQDLFDWLLAEDDYGNDAAMAKRFGIMYIIWNRKIWGSWGGWSTYCVQKPRGCIDPDDKDLRHPHTDHVHFSMSRAGATDADDLLEPRAFDARGHRCSSQLRLLGAG